MGRASRRRERERTRVEETPVERGIPDGEAFDLQLTLLESSGATRVTAFLGAGNLSRALRLLDLQTSVLLPLVNAELRVLDALATSLDAAGAKAQALLARRAATDMEMGVEGVLVGRQALESAQGRDLMEIELLLEDMFNDLRRSDEWLRADREERLSRFSAGVVRTRVTTARHPGRQKMRLPDADEYAVHSEGLHVTPDADVPGGRGAPRDVDHHHIAVLVPMADLLLHARKVIRRLCAHIAVLGAEPTDEIAGLLRQIDELFPLVIDAPMESLATAFVEQGFRMPKREARPLPVKGEPRIGLPGWADSP